MSEKHIYIDVFIRAALLKLQSAYGSPGDGNKIDSVWGVFRRGLRFWISQELSGDVSAAGPWTML